ncbi:MAG: ammonium transporter [Kordiimonadaceae bacterium]|nr:ammonium transporter [Kordiimonadaceae bacterium]MBO6570231.1 ammonium transporter [Kordiimonadaceae bacterium]MBO6965671.1 ammonium transporter [Kordiimonadaceae bacterium]
MLNNKFINIGVSTALLVGAISTPVFAGSPETDTSVIFNSLLFLLGGFLVMWMAAGFAMLEAGLVRSKNVADICLKNVSLFAVACLMWMLMGYNLMYTGVEAYFGTFFDLWSPDDVSLKEVAGAAGSDPAAYSTGSDFFFQMVFVATTASIVSGTVAERIKIVPFLMFTVVLAGIIYPIQGSWEWGGGWLDQMGFSDFAGSTLVHSTGGWAALVGALILGPRDGKYINGQVRPIPGSSMPLATLGMFILWLGWFGFNGASQLAMGTISDIVDISNVFVNTNMAASGGAVAAFVTTKIMYKKVDLTMVLNGALAGLVSITAEPLTPLPIEATLIGAVGGVLVVFAVPFFDKLKIDDVVGAISVHLVCGIWGTLAVPITNHADDVSFLTQLIGVASIGLFVTYTSAIVWFLLKKTVGIRLSPEDEVRGADISELGMEAYPEFGKGSQKF